ncbi:MAG: WYL domain-containing protein [Akkermansiaceae bacterium]|nr:WYL domain-containing protein [Akkermansiaceae bacterium]
MSKKSHDQYWAARQRLRFIETCAWWKGIVNRNDLVEIFSISMAQASSDMQAYLDTNPTALAYNLRQKRYEATAAMKWVITKPRLEEAAALFLGGDIRAPWGSIGDPGDKGDAVSVIRMPTRDAKEIVERRAFLAIMNGYRIRMRYVCANSGKDEWRRVRPHALAHDGSRWHLRGWCERHDDYSDFALGRIAEIEWTRDLMALPRPDEEWDSFVTLKVRPHRSLGALQKQAVELDYGMTGGSLKIKVRKAMEGYLRAQLGLPLDGGDESKQLLECV